MSQIPVGLTGTVVVRTRDDSDVQSVVGSRCGTSERGKGWDAPMVVIVPETTVRSPGAGREANARIGLVQQRFAFRCYGITDEQAEQLGLTVSGVWHECGPFEGTGGAIIHNGWADVILGPQLEPKIKRPMTTVYLDLLAQAWPIG